LPAGLDLAAYRIVQEALTNVRRHAEASTCEVLVHFGPESVQLEVVDDGRGGEVGRSGGHGLVGMHERVSLYGGELTAGSGPGGGFVVRASLPVGP
jgi:signal transduction histidine kinase